MWKASVFIRLSDLREKFAQTGRFGESASRFPHPNFCWQIFWKSPNLLADLLTGRFGESAGRFPPLADLLTGRFVFLPEDPPQFLLADFLTVTKSAGRLTNLQIWWICWQIWWICQQISPQYIYWLADLVNLPADSPPNFCRQIFWQSPNLLADLLTGRFGESAGRFPPWQIYWLADLCFCQQTPPNFCWQIFWQSPNLLVDWLTGRFPP